MVIEIIKMSHQYDCNPGEILENIGERLGICYFCLTPADEFHDGICKKCHEQLVLHSGRSDTILYSSKSKDRAEMQKCGEIHLIAQRRRGAEKLILRAR